MSHTDPQVHYGGGFDWSPAAFVQLQGAIDYADTAPSFALLDTPTITIVNRVFDYARQEVAEPLWIIGGNPNLGRGSRQSLTLSATLRPLGGNKLSLNIGYQRTRTAGGFSSFPELAPAVEAAFPDRIKRDAAGHLISVDARPINIAHDTTAGLNSGIALRLSGTSGARNRRVPVGTGDPWQISLSLNHQFALRSEMLIRAGLPVIDRLGGGSGASRHTLALQLGVGKRAFGVSLNANWASPAHIAATDTTSAFRIEPPLLVNFSTFVLGQMFGRSKQTPLLKGLKVSFDVQNLFNAYRHVTFADGSVLAGYTHDEIDPLGRTVRLTVRKRF